MDAPPRDSTAAKLDIRKYPNRRYYDTTHSRHLTLEEIRDLARDGHDIVVTDSKTGADITAQVLTQIILELETPKLDTFPVPMLLHVIRVNDRWMRGFFDTYFNRALEAYVEYQKQLQQQVRQMQGLPGVFPPIPPWAGQMFGGFGTPPPPPPPSSSTPKPPETPPAGASRETPDTAGVREDVDALRRQVAELRQQVGRKRRTPKRRVRRP